MLHLYERLKAAGCEIDNHESDLYVKDTPAAREIIATYKREGGSCSHSRFRSQIDGAIWFDIPFHFSPWWERRANRIA